MKTWKEAHDFAVILLLSLIEDCPIGSDEDYPEDELAAATEIAMNYVHLGTPLAEVRTKSAQFYERTGCPRPDRTGVKVLP